MAGAQLPGGAEKADLDTQASLVRSLLPGIENGNWVVRVGGRAKSLLRQARCGMSDCDSEFIAGVVIPLLFRFFSLYSRLNSKSQPEST